MMIRRAFTGDRGDWAFIQRAVAACAYNKECATEEAVFTALASGNLEYYIANGRCGGGIWWTKPDECWLTLFYRQGPPEGLRTDARLLRSAYEESVAKHGGAKVLAAVDAENPHARHLAWLHRHVMGLKPLQTITMRDMRQ